MINKSGGGTGETIVRQSFVVSSNYWIGIFNRTRFKHTGMNQLIAVVDELTPLSLWSNNTTTQKAPNFVKQKQNERKRLLKSQRILTN